MDQLIARVGSHTCVPQIFVPCSTQSAPEGNHFGEVQLWAKSGSDNKSEMWRDEIPKLINTKTEKRKKGLSQFPPSLSGQAFTCLS